ncbi:MAG: aldehyde dehydrogenase (NADP(+)) [Lutibacter sp.]
MVTGKNYIGNVLSSIGKKTFQTFNPETNSLNKTIFTEASIEELNTAVQLATEAFKVYQNISGKKKAQFLNEIANQIEALGDSLLQTYCAETGLPQGRAIGERTRTIFQLKSFAQLVAKGDWVNAIIDRADEQRKPIPKVDLRKMNIPIGPVVVFGASNFPLAYSTAGGDTAAALAAGCPVIVKSHPMHAGTGELVAGAVIKAAEITEMPNGIFSNLNSSGIEIGELLVKHPEVKAVGFTGSVQGGRALFNLASQRPEPIPVFAEMGSINPVVLLPHAAKTNYKKWANNYAQSIMLGSGQFCTNPGLILGLKSEFLTSFMQSLSEEIVKIDPSCMLNPAIIGNFEKKKAAMFQQSGINSVAENTKLLKTNYGKQAVATVDGETFLNNTLLHQEVFGPFNCSMR